jgi:hypothetical protein
MKIALAALLAILPCVSAAEALAVQVQCAKHEFMRKLLTKKFSEEPVAIGTVNQDRFMELFVSAEGTWTVLMTQTDGQACILAAGENWESLPQMAETGPAA